MKARRTLLQILDCACKKAQQSALKAVLYRLTVLGGQGDADLVLRGSLVLLLSIFSAFGCDVTHLVGLLMRQR